MKPKKRYIYNWRAGMWMRISAYQNMLLALARYEGEQGESSTCCRDRYVAHINGYPDGARDQLGEPLLRWLPTWVIR